VEEAYGAQPYELYIEIAKDIVIPIVATIIADWIIDKLSDKTNSIIIDGTEVRINKDAIEDAVIKIVTKSRTTTIITKKRNKKQKQ
jgi:hypothetical protein